MVLSLLHRRFTAWFALMALVLGALAPTVTQAMLTGGDRADWLVVCSANGMVWVQADTGEVRDQQPDSGSPMGDASQHCPWCTLHGGVAGLPSTQHRIGLTPRLTDLPPEFYRAPLVTTVWAPAQSRAPPPTA